MYKKLLSFCLTLILLCGAVPVFTLTANAESEYFFSYSVSANNEAVITDFFDDLLLKYNERVDVVVPEYLDGYPVTEIGYRAFAGVTTVRYLQLPEGLKKIGEQAFMGSTIEEMYISINTTNIWGCAFWNCTNLNVVYCSQDSYAYRMIVRDVIPCSYYEPIDTFESYTHIFYYDGTNKRPKVKVENLRLNVLTENVHYTVEYPKASKNVGEYKMVINFKNGYFGSKTYYYSVLPAENGIKASLSYKSATYNGKKYTPAVTVKNAKGKKLVKNVDYTVEYPAGMKKVGEYEIKVVLKGNYTGTKYLNFTINPPKTSVKKLTPAKKSMKIYVNKKSSQVTGYKIQYSTSKSFSAAKTEYIKSYKTTSLKVSGLKSNKTYYVRVKTYKTVNGKKYFSDWSKTKKVKIK